MVTLPVTPWGLEDVLRSTAERTKGAGVAVLSLAELGSIIEGWKGEIRRRQQAENDLAVAHARAHART